MNKKTAQGLPDFLEEIGTGIIYIYMYIGFSLRCASMEAILDLMRMNAFLVTWYALLF